jgi:hypothetical protein
MRSELGFAVLVLARKEWGRTPVAGRLRSERWWRQRLEELINVTEEPIPPENLWDSKPIDYPMPYEVEFNMSNASDCSYWLENHA